MTENHYQVEVGKMIDVLKNSFTKGIEVVDAALKEMHTKSRTWPYGQGRSLAVDMANEGYTIVGYDDVRVIRDDDSGIVEYKESGSWHELLRYDLTELEDDDGV